MAMAAALLPAITSLRDVFLVSTFMCSGRCRVVAADALAKPLLLELANECTPLTISASIAKEQRAALFRRASILLTIFFMCALQTLSYVRP